MNIILLIYLIGAAVTFLFFLVVNWITVVNYQRVGLFVVVGLAVTWPHTWWTVGRKRWEMRKRRRDRK